MKKIVFFLLLVFSLTGCSSTQEPKPIDLPSIKHTHPDAKFTLSTPPNWDKMDTVTDLNVNRQPLYGVVFYPSSKKKEQGIWVYVVDESSLKSALEMLNSVFTTNPSEKLLNDIKQEEQKTFTREGWQEVESKFYQAPYMKFLITTNQKGKATLTYAVGYANNKKYTIFVASSPDAAFTNDSMQTFQMIIDTFQPLKI